MSIRIDPGNPGQMALFEDDLKEQGFETNEEIEFVMSQVWDAEIKVKQSKLQCGGNNLVDEDYAITFFAD